MLEILCMVASVNRAQGIHPQITLQPVPIHMLLRCALCVKNRGRRELCIKDSILEGFYSSYRLSLKA